MKKQIAALNQQMRSLVTNQAPKKMAQPKRKRNRRRKRSSQASNDGRLTVSRWELITEIKSDTNSPAKSYYEMILPTATRMSWLNGLAKNFSRIVWHSLSIEYRPAVGAMKDGSVVVGIDWSAGTSTAPTKNVVQNCTPNFQVPVWQKRSMAAPSSKLQSRKEYILDASSNVDKAPGDILVALSCTSAKEVQYFGDIWVHYNVSLFGPK